ncbi:MmgE/PrpD family protein [Stappia sp. F7233]|uniref:MmgE/PrpD family protein n=1 Tax=Stappia albiluteola TaxID=2758565 RepID=A0A839AED7_9HYPH|nr:MmgE/PrpD family protein [Stappia albiluteola]MBA5778170.1 MmgE/PrpD family protein [Stappia albiluteola]
MHCEFTDFLHDLTYDDLTPQLKGVAKGWLLDLVAVAACATDTALSRIIRDHAADHFGAGTRTATMLFDGRRVSPAGAALAGGMTIDAIDAHDGHKLTKGHVGCGVLPALLAFCEAENIDDGGDFLASLVLGYEIGTRAGIALHRMACDYHTSGAWVAVAAAALGARALRLDAARTREAVGIAEYHGPRSQMMRCIDHPTMLKDGSGWGSMAGVSAAYLAAAGFTGAPAITVYGEDVSDLWSDFGQRWRILEQYFKPYPVCRWAQPSVQAVLDLRTRHGLTSEAVERIEIKTFHEAIRLAVRHPRTTEEAQYSTAFPVASALVRGHMGPAEVAERSFRDPEINRLADTITFTETEAFNLAFPARRFSDVTLYLGDGRMVSSGPTEAIGDPEVPVSTDAIRLKYKEYTHPVLGADRACAIETCIDSLASGTGLRSLFGLILAPAADAPLQRDCA